MELHQLMEGGDVITSTERPVVAEQQGGGLQWAYEMAAQWHDRAARDSEQMLSVLRKGSPEHKASTDSARHHRGSAAGLRMAAGLI